MDGREFIRRVGRLGRRTGVPVRLDSARGKGGHQRLHYGERITTVPTGEIRTGLLHALCKQLGIKPTDL